MSNAVSNFGITETKGVLTAVIGSEDSGNVFFNYIQGLIKITDVSYLSRENVRSTFLDDFNSFIAEHTPKNRIEFNYYDKENDTRKLYSVDCKLNGMPKPLYIFAINSDDKCNLATICLYQHEKWNRNFRSVSIFED